MNKINLLNYNRKKMTDFCYSFGEHSYRAIQVLQWIYKHKLYDFSKMHNINIKFRHLLDKFTEIRLPKIKKFYLSKKDGVKKWLMQLDCFNYVETVFIPENKRGTLCISSQVGCPINCVFCLTGKQNFNRNLYTSEIIGQVLLISNILSKNEKITNIVFMGMGEPLLNFNNVIDAIDIMTDHYAFGFSRKKIILSTSGIIPKLKLLQNIAPISLAISLHAPNNELRNILVPINKKYPICDLISFCKQYYLYTKNKITFEYVMLKNINDTIDHANQLIKLVKNISIKVNLIPFNSFANTRYTCSTLQSIYKFKKQLIDNGIFTTIRKTRGEDIYAACGQLSSTSYLV